MKKPNKDIWAGEKGQSWEYRPSGPLLGNEVVVITNVNPKTRTVTIKHVRPNREKK